MPSWQARLWTAMLPLCGNKLAMRNEGTLRAALWLTRFLGPALPDRRVRRLADVREERIAGARTFTVTPKHRGGHAGRILYLHGGGHVQHMIGPQWYLVRQLVALTGRTVIVPHYDRPPKAGAAQILEQVLAIYAGLAADGGSDDLALLGDSSGGGMVLALAQMMRDRGMPAPERLVMLAPWLDVAADDPQARRIEPRDPMLAQRGAQAAGRWYAQDIPLDDPRVSPLHGDLRGLPPMLLLVGTRDMLVAEARRLRARAAEQGAALAYREYADMFHVWALTPIPEGRAALAEVAAFLGPDGPGGRAAP